MKQIVPVCTVDDVRAEFKKRGISVSEWARLRGVSAQLTYQILAGRKVGLRGQSHQIAVLLGLKPGLLGEAEELRFSYNPFAAEPPDVSHEALGKRENTVSEHLCRRSR